MQYDKPTLISLLEDLWQEYLEDNPEEAECMDIPSAVEYYNQLSHDQVLQEYNIVLKQMKGAG